MAAVFTVEDGTGVADANSYITLADADQYVDNTSGDSTWTAPATDANKEKALRLATQYVDAEYADQWKGTASADNQSLDWPRAGVTLRDGYGIDSDEIPQALKDAVCELAVDYLVNGTLMADVSSPGSVKRKQAGPVSIEYFGADQVAWRRLTVNLLSDLIVSGDVVRRA